MQQDTGTKAIWQGSSHRQFPSPQPKIMKNSDKQPSWKLDCLNRGRAAAPPSSALCPCLCCCFELCHLQVLPLFLLLHCALFTLAQLDLPPLPVHFLPAASLLALLFQHYGWACFHCCLFQQRRSVVVLQREWERGKQWGSRGTESARDDADTFPEQGKTAKFWKGPPWLFLLKPHTPQWCR